MYADPLDRLRLTVSMEAIIVRRDPREERSIKMEREGNPPATSKYTRSFLEGSMVMKTLLKTVGVLGVSLVMSGKSWSIAEGR